MAILDVATALVRAAAPAGLADAIAGDLHERRAALAQTAGAAAALAAYRRDVLRSLASLIAYGASRALADNWAFALAAAAATCALCVATIPLWGHIGMGGAGYHLLRLAAIGLVLGCIPRASALSCIFLLFLIAFADWAMGARGTLSLVLQDGAALAATLAALQVGKVLRTMRARPGT